MAIESVSTNTNPNPVWRRWFRRTNVYIAEYILMLLLVGSFLGVLASLWFSFFQLILNDSYAGAEMARVAAGQLGAMIVLGLASFWLYGRVTGQEMVQPELYQRKSRTVFLTIWLVGMVLTIVGLVLAAVGVFTTSIFGFGPGFGHSLVGVVIPAILSVVTLGFGLFMIVKHVSRSFVLISAIALAVTVLILLVANVTMIVLRKDTHLPEPPQNCTFSRYDAGDCSYSDYLRYSRDRYGDDYNTRTY